MTKIKELNATVCTHIARKIEEALAPLALELGVKIQIKGGRYGDGYYTPKMEVALVGEDGAINSKEATAFKQLAAFEGLDPSDLGRTFTMNCKSYVITGLRTRAGKRPILAKSTTDGKEYVFTVDQVKKGLGKTPAKTPTRSEITVTAPTGAQVTTENA